MGKVFKDRLAPTKVVSQDKFWGESPTKDQAVSGNVSMGTSYGVGKNQPIGSHKQTSSDAIPRGCKTMDANDRIPKI